MANEKESLVYFRPVTLRLQFSLDLPLANKVVYLINKFS